MSHVLDKLLRRLRAEEGSFLVEVVVSAALLLTLAGGAMLALDAATQQSGTQRSRAVAATFAEQQLEELRTKDFAALAALNGTAAKTTIDGAEYTASIQTSEALVPEATGSGCDVSTRAPLATNVTVSVSWPQMRNASPVRVSTVIAAPVNSSATRGTLLVQIQESDGTGVPGLPVTLSGGPSGSLSGTTDENGCVRLADLKPAPTGYRLGFSRSGWVTPLGASSVDDPVEIQAGTQTKAYVFDRDGATITAKFVYKVPATKLSGTTSGQTVVDSEQLGATFIGADGARTAVAVDPAAKLVLSSKRYPHASDVGIHAGTCIQANVFDGAADRPIRPSGKPGTTVIVELPLADITLTNHNGNSKVWLKDACGAVFGPYTPDANGKVQKGLVYGPASVCAFRPEVRNGQGQRYARQEKFELKMDDTVWGTQPKTIDMATLNRYYGDDGGDCW